MAEKNFEKEKEQIRRDLRELERITLERETLEERIAYQKKWEKFQEERRERERREALEREQERERERERERQLEKQKTNPTMFNPFRSNK